MAVGIAIKSQLWLRLTVVNRYHLA